MFNFKSHPQRWLSKDDKTRSENMKSSRSLLVVQKMQTPLLRRKSVCGLSKQTASVQRWTIIVNIDVSLWRVLKYPGILQQHL